ncbi:2',3'-cyclic-nucleotide 3'-phosphodiesterase [Ganoderma leucocontextum]|nr:2',3'-cyclic-nucleotide 3'-phosphodiesterase [Ganoderma leucocontextum]
MGISLWLVPKEADADRIKQVMRNRPTASTKSPSSFPTFHPHVTLATGPDAAALRAALPSDQPVVPVQFKSAEVGDKYFMSIYVVVHSPEGSPLENLCSHLRAALGDAAVPPIPHLSLYYIDDADKDTRLRTLQELHAHFRVIGKSVGDSVMADFNRMVGLGCYASSEPNEADPPYILRQTESEEIWLVRCEGPVEGWEVLEKFPLGK